MSATIRRLGAPLGVAVVGVSRPKIKPFIKNLALRTAVIYGVVAGIWVLLSDKLVPAIAKSPDQFVLLSTVKGWFFVLATAIMLHSLIKRGLGQISRFERTLIDSEQRLADTINFLPDATVVIDCDGKVIAWNHAMEELSGVNAEDILGQGDYVYSIPFYGNRAPMLADIVLKPDQEIHAEYDLAGKEKETLFAEVHLPDFWRGNIYLWAKARALYDSDGKLVGAIETLRDITEHKLADEERTRQHEREWQIESEAELAKQQFYQRTIYSVTDGKLNLMSHAQIDALIGDDSLVLDLNGGGCISNARQFVAQAAETAGMSEDRVFALGTAFGEAAANAVKHAGGGKVRVSVLDGSVQVCVSDNGEGMDQLILPTATLLSRFSTKASMGLGYSLILGLVDKVYLATDKQGTSILIEQAIMAPSINISLEAMPDTW